MQQEAAELETQADKKTTRRVEELRNENLEAERFQIPPVLPQGEAPLVVQGELLFYPDGRVLDLSVLDTTEAQQNIAEAEARWAQRTAPNEPQSGAAINVPPDLAWTYQDGGLIPVRLDPRGHIYVSPERSDNDLFQLPPSVPVDQSVFDGIYITPDESDERRRPLILLMDEQGRLHPLGFYDYDEFVNFGKNVVGGFSDAGYANVGIIFHGSSVTGKRFTTGEPFDHGNLSDYDLAIVSPGLVAKAKEVGVEMRSKGTRTEPLEDEDHHEEKLRALGLWEFKQALAEQFGRPVHFTIYESEEAALARGPSIMVPK